MKWDKIINIIITIALIAVIWLFFQMRNDMQKERQEFKKIMNNYTLVADKQKAVLEGMDKLSKDLGAMADKVSSISSGIGKVSTKIGGVINIVSSSKDLAEESKKLLKEQQEILERLQQGSDQNPE